MAGICPSGSSWETVRDNLRKGVSAIKPIAEWAEVSGLGPRAAGMVEDFAKPAHYPRKKVRSMGRVALMATRATEWALTQANLLESPVLDSGQTGIAYGSTIGAEPAIRKFAERIGFNSTLTGITGATFIQLMSHTCAANLAQFFGIKGRVLPTNAGDTSGSQGLGYGLETLNSGFQDVMVAGGAEALSMVGASFFDMLGAASHGNPVERALPRPFDRHSDGLVVAEGAATLVLERATHARQRGCEPLGQMLGYASVCDRPRHLHPLRASMVEAIRSALAQAELNPEQIGFVHAHGLGSKAADMEESWAIADVFGTNTPVTNLKSYFGHTQAGCAAIESWLVLALLNEGWVPPILNLEEPHPDCAPLAYARDQTSIQAPYALLLTYAYSGVITALVLGSADTARA